MQNKRGAVLVHVSAYGSLLSYDASILLEHSHQLLGVTPLFTHCILETSKRQAHDANIIFELFPAIATVPTAFAIMPDCSDTSARDNKATLSFHHLESRNVGIFTTWKFETQTHVVWETLKPAEKRDLCAQPGRSCL
jgi:hypothetical protein